MSSRSAVREVLRRTWVRRSLAVGLTLGIAIVAVGAVGAAGGVVLRDPEVESLDEAVARALSFTPWPDYTVQVETSGEGTGTYEVVVREGEVVARRGADPRIDDFAPAGSPDPDSFLAPSLAELQATIAAVHEHDPAAIAELVVDETGHVLRVAFAPSSTPGDEVAYRVFADVDSPGDPVEQDR